MSITNKIDTRTLSLVLIALIGGVIGGYLSGATFKDTKIESLSNAFVAQLDTKDTEIASLSDAMSDLEEQLSNIEASIADPIIGFNTPDFDSGWIDIEQGGTVEVNHNLGTRNLFVYLIGALTHENEDFIHQHHYGTEAYGLDVITPNGGIDTDFIDRGVWWHISDENKLKITRVWDDYDWHRFRVLLWRLSEPPVVWEPVS